MGINNTLRISSWPFSKRLMLCLRYYQSLCTGRIKNKKTFLLFGLFKPIQGVTQLRFTYHTLWSVSHVLIFLSLRPFLLFRYRREKSSKIYASSYQLWERSSLELLKSPRVRDELPQRTILIFKVSSPFRQVCAINEARPPITANIWLIYILLDVKVN